MKYALGDKRVKTHGDDFWIAPGAVVVGEVTLGRDVSVWWNAVIRADNDPVIIGDNTNIQDGSVIHADPGYPAIIGRNVTVGHMAVIHGCTIGDDCLVGIGSVILNGAKIGKGSVIGARALITEGKEFPENVLILGAPAKVVRTLSPEEAQSFQRAAGHYVQNAKRFKADVTPDE